MEYGSLLVALESSFDEARMCGSAIGSGQDGDHVKADRYRLLLGHLEIPAGQARQAPLLFSTNRFLWMGEPSIHGAAFHFHKTEHLPIPSHQVNLAESAPDVAPQDPVAVGLEDTRSQRLGAPA